MYANLWIIEWREPGRAGDALDTASTPEEAATLVRRFLENETAFDEEVDEDRPALDVLFDGHDPVTLLRDMDDRIELKCENGNFTVRRTVRFRNDETPRCLDQAARSLFDFARLFLAYHDAETPETVTIATLEHAARTAVATAIGDPPHGPMTSESVEKLKQHYLVWTGGFAPADDDEVFTYIELAMEAGPDPEEARMVLRNWMSEANNDNLHPAPDHVLCVNVSLPTPPSQQAETAARTGPPIRLTSQLHREADR